MPTAREDYSLLGLPNIHIFTPTLYSLAKQTFRDFELIIVDALYPKRREIVELNWGYPIKYIPIHPDHRTWLDKGRWNVCGQLNTAIMYADGELICRLDDCSEFDENYLRKFWKEYQAGFFPMAMHVRYNGGKPARIDDAYLKSGYEAKYSETFEGTDRVNLLKRIYGEEGIVRDTRWVTVEKAGGRMIAPHNWGYGYSSFSLEAALKVNGYDENFDGDKSVEDCDFTSRLYMAGYNKALLDVNLSCIEHEHLPITLMRDTKPIKCNWALYLLNRSKNRIVANQDKLTLQDKLFIVGESLNSPCTPKKENGQLVENFYLDFKGELFDYWFSNQKIFDLRYDRLGI